MFYEYACSILEECPDVILWFAAGFWLTIASAVFVGAAGVLAWQELQRRRGETSE